MQPEHRVFAPVSSSAGPGLPDRQGIVMPFIQRNLLASQPEALYSSPDFLLIGGLWFVLVTCNDSLCMLRASGKLFPLITQCDGAS